MASEITVFSGKAGARKTTIASLVLREMIRLGRKPLLAVGLATVERVLRLAEGLPIRRRRCILAMNNIPPDRPAEGRPHAGPGAGGMETVVEIHFDNNAAAGREAQPTVEDLASISPPTAA